MAAEESIEVYFRATKLLVTCVGSAMVNASPAPPRHSQVCFREKCGSSQNTFRLLTRDMMHLKSLRVVEYLLLHNLMLTTLICKQSFIGFRTHCLFHDTN